MVKNKKLSKNAWVHQNREIILRELGDTCEICGTDKNIQVHHKKYTNNLEDLQILCFEHHNDLHSKLIEENGYLKGTFKVSKNKGYGVIKIQSKKITSLIGTKTTIEVNERKKKIKELNPFIGDMVDVYIKKVDAPQNFTVKQSKREITSQGNKKIGSEVTRGKGKSDKRLSQCIEGDEQ